MDMDAMGQVDQAGGARPARSSATSSELTSLGHFWRIAPSGRTHVVEFWRPGYVDLNGRPVQGAWRVAQADAPDAAGAIGVMLYHIPDLTDLQVVDAEFERRGHILVRVERHAA